MWGLKNLEIQKKKEIEKFWEKAFMKKSTIIAMLLELKIRKKQLRFYLGDGCTLIFMVAYWQLSTKKKTYNATSQS